MGKIIRILESPVTPYIVVGVVSFLLLVPVIWMILTSFKTLGEILSIPITILPRKPTLEAYIAAFLYAPLLTYLKNSLIISLACMVIVLIASIFTAYGLSQYKYRHSDKVMLLFLFSRMIPPVSLLVSFYVILSNMGLIDNLIGVILFSSYQSYPMIVWLLKGFFDQFPRELIEAAKVDGCSRTGAFLRVVLPVSANMIAAIGIIAFMWGWQEFIGPLLFIMSEHNKPVTVGLYWFVGDEGILWNRLCAAGTVTIIPGVIFFLLAQRYIIKGLAAGAVKR